MKKKRILFVCYGGGHAKRLIPVYKRLSDFAALEITVLALTLGEVDFRKAGIDSKGFRHYDLLSSRGRKIGEKMAESCHNPDAGIPLEETVSYMGANYDELVDLYGEIGANEKYSQCGRSIFFPINSMRKIIKEVSPDVLITTDSPRSEQAALSAATEMGIPTVMLVNFYSPRNISYKADRVCLLSDLEADRFRARGVPSRNIMVTGNPCYDRLYHSGNENWNTENFTLPGNPDDRYLLYLDMGVTVVDRENERSFKKRSRSEIVRDLNMVNQIRNNFPNLFLLVRPHPSQPVGLYKNWCESSGKASLALDEDLYSLFKSVDLVIGTTSSAMWEAAESGVPLLQLNINSPSHLTRPLLGQNCFKAFSEEDCRKIFKMVSNSQLKHIQPDPEKGKATEKICDVLLSV